MPWEEVLVLLLGSKEWLGANCATAGIFVKPGRWGCMRSILLLGTPPPVRVLWKEVLVLLPGSRERLDSPFLQLQPNAGVERAAPIPARRKLLSGPGNPTRSSHVTLRNEAIYVKTSGHPAALVPSPHPSQLFFGALPLKRDAPSYYSSHLYYL